MRTRQLFSFAILSLAACLAVVGTERAGLAQKGGRGGFKFDPGQWFDRMSNGQSFITIATQQRGKEQMEEFAKKEGITDGKLTREQFVKYMEQMMQNRGKGGGPGGRGGSPTDFIFKRYDTNGDGKLNETEIAAMSDKHQEFKADWKKYDTNKDNLISLEEYKVYMDARMKAKEERKDGDKEAKKDGDKKDGDKKDETKKDGDKKAEAKPSILRIEIDDIEDIKPVVYRAGNLPKELPDWFKELDTNKDGQVSLMEWVKGGKTMSDFAKLDRNDDGLLTPEEVLRHQQLIAGTTTVATNGAEAPRSGGPPSFGKGGRGPGGFTKGGFKGKRGNRGGPN